VVNTVVVASTLYGVANVAAAIDAGALGSDERRILVTANTSTAPEVARSIDELPGFSELSTYFDEVHSYNEAIAPYHPSDYRPAGADVPLLERFLRGRWGLGHGLVELVVESIPVPPSLALAEIFRSSRVTVYAEGLMSYGPTRNRIGFAVGDRIRTVVHPDLVPGLRPVLLREFDVPAVGFDTKHLREVFDRVTGAVDLSELPATAGDHVLVIGQYLAAVGVLTDDQERELHQRMVTAAVGAGAGTVWFKPHPSAPLDTAEELRRWAGGEGIDLPLVPPLVPAEAVLATAPPAYVVGCFSTALMTAPRLYGVPSATVGIDLILEALTPYENSNRVPATIVGEVLDDLERSKRPPSLLAHDERRVVDHVQPLVDSVAYCMQPVLLPQLAQPAAAWLARHLDEASSRYFKRRRLTSLGLPGGAALPLWRKVARSERARRARRLVAAGVRSGRAAWVATRG